MKWAVWVKDGFGFGLRPAEAESAELAQQVVEGELADGVGGELLKRTGTVFAVMPYEEGKDITSEEELRAKLGLPATACYACLEWYDKEHECSEVGNCTDGGCLIGILLGWPHSRQNRDCSQYKGEEVVGG